MLRIMAVFACLTLMGVGVVHVVQAETVAVSRMSLMTFETDATINAPAAKVWTSLTDADKAMSWCPLWKSAKDPQPLTKVGNTITFVDDWQNVGKSVVIFVDPNKELRLAHVPDDGSYVCQLRVVLTPAEGGTRVHVTEQYSDALDAPTDKDTAAKTQAEIAGYVAALKAAAEKK
ncbi:MAG TPA: SRPBCC domain-containing protein [Candidatus Krumholzibacteria bacterium]|nr:SRPBCC domain-containing protein [Candidatus Krumholzibacteria bacterium]